MAPWAGGPDVLATTWDGISASPSKSGLHSEQAFSDAAVGAGGAGVPTGAGGGSHVPWEYDAAMLEMRAEKNARLGR